MLSCFCTHCTFPHCRLPTRHLHKVGPIITYFLLLIKTQQRKEISLYNFQVVGLRVELRDPWTHSPNTMASIIQNKSSQRWKWLEVTVECRWYGRIKREGLGPELTDSWEKSLRTPWHIWTGKDNLEECSLKRAASLSGMIGWLDGQKRNQRRKVLGRKVDWSATKCLPRIPNILLFNGIYDCAPIWRLNFTLLISPEINKGKCTN